MKRSGFRPKTYAEAVSRQGKNGLKRHSKPRRGIRIDAADRFFSLYIRFRDRWTCQRCLRRFEPISAGLHNSHFFGRARENTRFSDLNCDALCHGCHAYFTSFPEYHREWKLQRLGESVYNELRIAADTRCKKDRKLQALVAKKLFEQERARYEKLAL